MPIDPSGGHVASRGTCSHSFIDNKSPNRSRQLVAVCRSAARLINANRPNWRHLSLASVGPSSEMLQRSAVRPGNCRRTRQQSHQQHLIEPFHNSPPSAIATAMSQVTTFRRQLSASLLHRTLNWTRLLVILVAATATASSQLIPQQVAPINDHSSLIIENYYHNYHYNPNSYHRPIQRPHSHYNEPDWSNGQMNNITASVGRNATFECHFPGLKQDFWLAWFHKESHTLLALSDSVILKNGRVSVRSHANTTFYLTLHDIRYEDRGLYECQINTVPIRKKLGYLEVNVPPSFDELLTSSDVDVHEGSPVTLRCSADGRPTPEISWRREDGSALDFGQSNKSADIWKGEFLNISNSRRTHSGAYLCIASNGIPSPISKRIFLGVRFPPVIKSNREELGVYLGSSVMLLCHVEAYPRPTFYWQKDDNMPPIIHSDKKYEISLLEGNTSYRFTLKLKILNVAKSDYGIYTCTCKNSLSEAKASMRVYEIKQVVPPTPRPNKRPKNIFLDIFSTTKLPAQNETKANEEKMSRSKVQDNFSFNQKTKTEVFDYETNFISPEMGSEAKENKASSHLTAGWPILFSSSFLLVQRVFAFAG